MDTPDSLSDMVLDDSAVFGEPDVGLQMCLGRVRLPTFKVDDTEMLNCSPSDAWVRQAVLPQVKPEKLSQIVVMWKDGIPAILKTIKVKIEELRGKRRRCTRRVDKEGMPTQDRHLLFFLRSRP